MTSATSTVRGGGLATGALCEQAHAVRSVVTIRQACIALGILCAKKFTCSPGLGLATSAAASHGTDAGQRNRIALKLRACVDGSGFIFCSAGGRGTRFGGYSARTQVGREV